MEISKLKYPIKYAIMSFEKANNFGHDIVFYITSKCYVVSEKYVYGSENVKYVAEVVFLWSEKDIMEHLCFNRGFKRTVPKYDFDFECINYTKVNRLFDSFDEASIITDKLNKEILDHELGTIPFDQNYEVKRKKIEETYYKTLSKYKKIEQIIETETIDTEITYDSVNDYKNKQKIYNVC